MNSPLVAEKPADSTGVSITVKVSNKALGSALRTTALVVILILL